ncbi:hypothetical protein KKC60_03895, partial [Patescibacteria group bacterium]|nr:hypothetical protein [Patescibacteria group bacterium]
QKNFSGLKKKKNKLSDFLENVTRKIFGSKGKSKLFALGAVVVVVILIISLIWFIASRNKTEQAQENQDFMAQAQELEKKAADALIYDDRNQANEHLKEAEKLIAFKLEDDQKYASDLAALKEKIQADKDKIDRITRVNPTELATLENSQDGGQILGFGSDLFIYSKERIKVYKYDSGEKKFAEFSTSAEGLSKLVLGVFNDQKNIITFLASKSFAEMPVYLKEISRVDTDFPENNHEFADMAIYSDKIYLLDPKNNQIYRHTRTVDGYGPGKAWVESDGVSLENATSLAIDSNIYVLKADGQILKFNRGETSDFEISGLAKPLSEASSLFTSDEHQYIYALDKSNQRIVVMDKKGVLTTQYALDGIEAAEDIYVDPESETIYLLADQKLFEIAK